MNVDDFFFGILNSFYMFRAYWLMFNLLQAEVTQRLANAREAVNRSGSFPSHEDLAKKLKVTWVYTPTLYLNFCDTLK